ncbi:cyclophilin-like fold protein [Caballeronia sp. BR00000012568055]|uniref:cyclophilin-like fold protein n=1 Tax=Caballeronia sp. BR00000012568055 TaxID=2918761 RepID=UPI0023F781B9
MSGRLDDNATSRDFVAMLPLPLRLVDFAATEKIAYLPRRLNTDGTPSGIVPYAGDVTYYEPWGTLQFFTRTFGIRRAL